MLTDAPPDVGGTGGHSVSSDRDVLARCVGDVGSFERDHWGRAPLVHRATSDSGFTDVWSIAAHDDFLVGGIRRPLVRLVRDGTAVPSDEYTCRVRLGGREFDDVIDPAGVASSFAAGATVVAQSIHRTAASVRRFTEQLADSISHPIQANSYLTPPGAAGLAPHADRHDVFVLQVEGTKSWSIDGIAGVELRPGDTLYIPAGTLHSAVSTDRTSLHLTIGVLSVTYRSVLRRLLDGASPALDDPLPLRFGTASDDLTAGIERLLTDVGDHLRTIDPWTAAEHEAGRRVSRPPRPGALSAVASTAALCGATTVVRTGAPWAFHVVDHGRVEIRSDGRRLTAPESCRAALEQIALGSAVTVGDLVGLDARSQVILARRLVRETMCTIDDQPRPTIAGSQPDEPLDTA